MQVYGVTHDSGQEIIPIGGTNEQELCKLIARSKKYGPIYTGFNQGNTERFWYACVIVSWLRSWFTLWNPTEDFTALMYELCDDLERKGVWNSKAGGAVNEMGDCFVNYMNNRFPNRKVWKTKVGYGSSAMGGCLNRNIPIVTAYLSSTQYHTAQADGEITEEETNGITKSSYGHCITITGLGPLWLWLRFQDNYDGQAGNTYRTFNFKRLLRTVWYPSCFWALLPVEMESTAIKDRAGLVNSNNGI